MIILWTFGLNKTLKFNQFLFTLPFLMCLLENLKLCMYYIVTEQIFQETKKQMRDGLTAYRIQALQKASIYHNVWIKSGSHHK